MLGLRAAVLVARFWRVPTIISLSLVQPSAAFAVSILACSDRLGYTVTFVGLHSVSTSTMLSPTSSEMTPLGPWAPLFSIWGSDSFLLPTGDTPFPAQMPNAALFGWRVPVTLLPFVFRCVFGTV